MDIHTTKRGHDNKKVWNHWPRGEKAVVVLVLCGRGVPGALGLSPQVSRLNEFPLFSPSKVCNTSMRGFSFSGRVDPKSQGPTEAGKRPAERLSTWVGWSAVEWTGTQGIPCISNCRANKRKQSQVKHCRSGTTTRWANWNPPSNTVGELVLVKLPNQTGSPS